MKILPALLAAPLLWACQHVEETSREYPIAKGRYYSAADLALKPVDSVLFHYEFDPDTRIYLEFQDSRPGCTALLTEGHWFVYTNVAYPETVLKLKYLRAAGITSGEDCQTLDSLSKARTDLSESYWIRNITDTSYETCDYLNEICFEKCRGRKPSRGEVCYGWDSTVSVDTYWEKWVKR